MYYLVGSNYYILRLFYTQLLILSKSVQGTGNNSKVTITECILLFLKVAINLMSLIAFNWHTGCMYMYVKHCQQLLKCLFFISQRTLSNVVTLQYYTVFVNSSSIKLKKNICILTAVNVLTCTLFKLTLEWIANIPMFNSDFSHTKSGSHAKLTAAVWPLFQIHKNVHITYP